MSKWDDAKKAEDAKKAAEAKAAEDAAKAAKKKAEARMADEEIEEYQHYWTEQEVNSGGHRLDIAAGAATVLLLIEILKELRRK